MLIFVWPDITFFFMLYFASYFVNIRVCMHIGGKTVSKCLKIVCYADCRESRLKNVGGYLKSAWVFFSKQMLQYSCALLIRHSHIYIHVYTTGRYLHGNHVAFEWKQLLLHTFIQYLNIRSINMIKLFHAHICSVAVAAITPHIK